MDVGPSRQHAVNLRVSGVPDQRTDAHQRLCHKESGALPAAELTRDQLKSLWLHRAVAGKLVADPDRVVAKALDNLRQLDAIHPTGMTARWLGRWRSTLDTGIEAVLDALTSREQYAVELRQNSPFAGVLLEAERLSMLNSFGRHWQRDEGRQS